MKKLYHYPICPLSRQVRVYLKELDIPFTMVKEDYWLKRKEFLKINPAGNLPVLEEPTGLVVCGIYPITEYFNEKYPNFSFMPEDRELRADIRRLVFWFNDKFFREVTRVLISEKVERLMLNFGGPRTEFIRIAKTNLATHMTYLSGLLERSSFVGSDSLTCADIAASCQLSVLDYFGEIYWDNWPVIRDWYAVLKSRPSFRPLLQDLIPGFTPSPYYADLDF